MTGDLTLVTVIADWWHFDFGYVTNICQQHQFSRFISFYENPLTWMEKSFRYRNIDQNVRCVYLFYIQTLKC